MLNSSNSYYYVSDWNSNKIFNLNESWSYVSSKTFNYPTHLTIIGNNLYATTELYIWKLDQNLTILIHSAPNGYNPGYRVMYFNSTTNLIYIAPYLLNEIHVFDLDPNLDHNFSTSSYSPWSITEYNNQMYVGTTNGTILVIVNEVIINTFNGCNGNSVQLSYNFDQCGLMATSCENSQLYLYDPNVTYLSKNKATPIYPNYIGYDSKGRFVQISAYQISKRARAFYY